ncbi:MAG TPA: MerR family transcriptional regulator [Lichenihabitans sp.]|nr:MerR family transcriptional regulator [Lichenihabitans sp.]
MPIGDMARAYRISLRALRFYENRGLIRPRREGAVRLYGPGERHKLEMILKGKLLGFTLSEIRDMIVADSPDGESLPLNAEQIARQIDHLEQQRLTVEKAIRELQRVRRRLRPAS